MMAVSESVWGQNFDRWCCCCCCWCCWCCCCWRPTERGSSNRRDQNLFQDNSGSHLQWIKNQNLRPRHLQAWIIGKISSGKWCLFRLDSTTSGGLHYKHKMIVHCVICTLILFTRIYWLLIGQNILLLVDFGLRYLCSLVSNVYFWGCLWQK